eukprot:gene3821-4081_t
MISEVDRLFKKLDNDLGENVNRQYFQEPREFRSLIEVIAVLNEQVDQMNRHKELGNDLTTVLREDTNSQAKLHHQLDIVNSTIEEIVSFQQGGLNNSLDTMSEVVKEYNRSREEIQTLRKSLEETQTVLTAKKLGQISLKELWGKRVELKETLRMVRELEELKNFPLKANRLIQQRRYLTTAKQLKEMLEKIFSEDFASVGGLLHIREQLFNLKEKLLETSIEELKESIVHFHASNLIENTFEDVASFSDDDDASEVNGSVRSFSYHQHYSQPVANMDETASAVSNSRRPSFANNGAGGGQAVTSSVTSLFYSNMSNNTDFWSYNLRDVDEALEGSLLDPSASGPLFIRLLVKTISQLNFEDDVEHLLDDTILNGFRQSIIPRVKMAAQNKLNRALQQQQQTAAASGATNNPSSFVGTSPLQQDESLRLHGKLFNEYVYLLLEMILGIFQRTIYVYKLLSYSKSLNRQNGGSNQSNTSSDYLSVDTQRRLLTRLTNVVLQIEDLIQKELEIHLVEADVQNISDTNTKRSSGNSGGSGKRSGEDEEEDEAMTWQGKTIYRSSVWHAAFLYSNIYKYNFKLYKLLTDNFDEDVIVTVMSLATSSSSDDMSYSSGGSRHSTQHLSSAYGGQQTITNFTSSLLPFIRNVIETEFIPVVQSWVNQELRELMETHSLDSLNPSTAQSMIEQRQKLNHARIQIKQMKAASGHGSGASSQETIHQLTIASTLSTMMIHVVLSTCSLLLKLWYQLFDHRDFLVVVYDRLLKTVNTMMEENQDFLISTFNVITYLAKISFQPYLVKDWNYNVHKQRSTSTPYQSLMDMMNKIQMNLTSSDGLIAPVYPTFHLSTSTSSQNNMSTNNLTSSKNEGIAINSNQVASETQELHMLYVEEFATLQRAFKELQGLPLPKFQPDHNMIGVLGIFAHDSDWLVRKLFGLCLQTVKKSNAISNLYLASTSSSTTSQQQQSNQKFQSFKNIRQSLLESKKTLITTTLENLQTMQRHAETSLSMVRKILQILSFYQVNGLVTAFYDFILQPNKGSFSEEGTVSIFLTPISNLIEILSEILPTILLVSTIATIVTTLPRIFLRGIISPFLSGQTTVNALLFPENNNNSTTSYNSSPSTPSSSGGVVGGGGGVSRAALIKSCLLRLAVTMQQQLLLLIQSVMDKEVESRRRIVDICSDEFERIRRYIAMIDTPAAEIQGFIDNERDFMDDEFKALRMLCSRAV